MQIKTVLSSRKDENTMKYDFTTILDRKGKDSIAVEPFEADWIKWPGKTKEGFDIIPNVGGRYELSGCTYDPGSDY